MCLTEIKAVPPDSATILSDQPYSHILALDVTPIYIGFTGGDEKPKPTQISEYDIDNAAYVHVFVPVMFSISASSGDQYARMKVDWTTLEKIEHPENNLEYSLWNAKQIEQGDYTDAFFAKLQIAIEEVTAQLENIWPSQTLNMNGSGFSAQPELEQREYSDAEKSEMIQKLNTAVSSLHALTKYQRSFILRKAVPLHVFVPVTEDISEGTGDQDVLLKLDWSTLTKTSEDDPGFQPEDPVKQSPAVDITDAATGVKIHADKGVFEEGVKIVVTEIKDGSDYDKAANALSDAGKKFKLYDVKFLDKDSNEVAPNGTVTISFPAGAGYKNSVS